MTVTYADQSNALGHRFVGGIGESSTVESTDSPPLMEGSVGQMDVGSAGAVPYYVAALLPPGTPRWNDGSSLGTPATVTYSFMTEAPSYAYYTDAYGFAPMSTEQQAAVRLALATWAEVANISFREVSDAGSGGTIRFGTNDQNGVSNGYAYYPNTDVMGGDVYIANDQPANSHPVPGDRAFLTLVHEIGHAIGLKHTGNYDANGGGAAGPWLPADEDNYQYSLMSYNPQPWSNYATYAAAPALYDVAAIQYLYSANSRTHAGDDVYSLSNTETPFTKVIWDAAGSDTLDASAQTLRSIIDLNAGAFSSIGTNGSGGPALNNVSIAYGVSIGNAVGGSGSDTLNGNVLDNHLSGGAGNDKLYGRIGSDLLDGGSGSDVLDGGAGLDTAVWSRPRHSYTISMKANADDTVADSTGTDTVIGNSIEHFRFTDGEFVTDTASTAAQVYRLYGASLGRHPDAGGLKTWVSELESGSQTLKQTADGLTASPEFAEHYGNPGDTAFVTLLYKNVLERQPDSPGLATWTDALASGMSRSDLVLDFSESAENIALTSPNVEQGLWLRDDYAAQVARLYHATLDRLPDADGLVTWTEALRNGASLSQVSDGFTNSVEFQQHYGNLDDAGFTTLLYNNVLGRQPDSAGLAAWTADLSSGESRHDVVIGFSESAEHQNQRAHYIDDGIVLQGDEVGLVGQASHVSEPISGIL